MRIKKDINANQQKDKAAACLQNVYSYFIGVKI